MTNPITPPPELVNQWCHEDGDEIKTSPRWYQRVCAKAAQWGWDQRGAVNEDELQKARDEELKAICEWLSFYSAASDARDLHAARRPNPQSLKEQAIAKTTTILDDPGRVLLTEVRETLELTRRALLAQPEPEGPKPMVDYSRVPEMATEAQIRSAAQYLAKKRNCDGDLIPAIEYAIARWGRPTPQPVAVSERPWERDGWCDEQGRCWAWHPFDPENDETGDYWSRIPWHWIDDIGIWSHCLPASALPTPENTHD